MRKFTAADVYLMKNCKDMKINTNSSQLLYLHQGGDYSQKSECSKFNYYNYFIMPFHLSAEINKKQDLHSIHKQCRAQYAATDMKNSTCLLSNITS